MSTCVWRAWVAWQPPSKHCQCLCCSSVSCSHEAFTIALAVRCFFFFRVLFCISILSWNSTWFSSLSFMLSHVSASKVHSATMTVKRSSWQQQSRARTPLSAGSEFTVLMLSVLTRVWHLDMFAFLACSAFALFRAQKSSKLSSSSVLMWMPGPIMEWTVRPLAIECGEFGVAMSQTC